MVSLLLTYAESLMSIGVKVVVVTEGVDVYEDGKSELRAGKGLALAARLMGLATTSGICVSSLK